MDFNETTLKSRRTIRIANQKSSFEIMILAAIFVIVILGCFIMAVKIHNNASMEFAHFRATQIARRFHSYISRTLVLAQKASMSNAIKSWFSDEENSEKREDAYHEMLDYSSVLSSPHLYFGIQKSLGDYSFRPDMTLRDFLPYKRLDPNEPWDSWYFDCVNSGEEHVLNFDKDLDTQIWKLWLNHKVRAGSEIAGVFCIAFEIDDLRAELFTDHDPQREQFFIVNEEGTILMSSGSVEYYSSENRSHIGEMFKDKAFVSLLEKSLSGGDDPSLETAVKKSSAIPFRYNAFMRIPETGWTAVVVFDSNYLTGLAGMADFLPLPLILFFALFAYVVISNIYTTRFVFRPLASLTRNIAEAAEDSVELFGNERYDEIGELSRAIRESRNRLNLTHTILREVIQDKEDQERLLYAVTETASTLLTSRDDEDRFSDTIYKAMGAIGDCLTLDHISVWKAETGDEVLRYDPKYEWPGTVYGNQKDPFGEKKRYRFDGTGWTEKLARGECINGPVGNLTEIEQDILSYAKLKSILLIPIHLRDTFWGFINFGDGRSERNFSDEEISILRSASLMMVSMIERNTQTLNLKRVRERARIMLDMNPLACVLWNKDYRIFDCNEEALRIFGIKTKDEFIEKFPRLLPEFQGEESGVPVTMMHHVKIAFDEGRLIFNRVYQTLDGTPIPAEVILIRVPYRGDFAVAGYIRDLREHKQMMQEIEKKTSLLQIVNQASLILLSRKEKSFEGAMSKSLDLFAGLASIDRMSVFRNTEVPEGGLALSQIYRWRKEEKGVVKVWDELQSVPLSAFSPQLVKTLMSGECIGGLISQLPDNAIFKRFDCVTILIVPVFDDSKLWGFTLFERLTEENFMEYETSVLRSASFMLANAVIRNEEANLIRRANEQSQIILDALPISITIWDRNKKVINCSQYAVNLFGFSSKKELLERLPLCMPEYQPGGKKSIDLMLEAGREAFETGYSRMEWTHLTASGEPIVFDSNAIRIKYSGDDVLMFFSRDIREDKKMLAELAERDKILAEQTHWYKSLLDGIPLPISVTDPDMKLVFANIVAETMFGMKREKLYGEHCSVWDCPICNTPDCSIARVKQGYHQTFFKNKGLSYKVDSEIIRDLTGETQGYLEVLHDITEVENMARQQADAENEAKTAFLANMSHEMRTPLNAIIGLSELTLTSERLDEEAQSNLIKIHNAGATLVSTVNDILDISKIEAGKFELVPIEYELPSLLNDTITQTIMYMEEKPLKFILDIEKDLPMRLFGDELRVKEVLNNLLSNAFKYTREGTIELGMRCEREDETLWLTMWVKDTGIGIREEDAARIFSDYVQLDKKSNRKIQGTGLGLAITKHLIELMEGEISVQSDYGKGATFTARFKQKYVGDETIGPDMVQNLKNFRYIERKRRKDLRLGYLNMSYARVLVVDDIVTNLDVVKGMLKPYGMKVDCVTSGQEAVNAVREEKVKYNAVFMDHMMPEMDGIEAVRIIREEIGTEYAKTIPIIALTANAIIGNEEKFLKAGFQAFISKPIELSRLDNAVREWVRDKEQEKLLEKAQINVNGELVQDTRSGKERRVGIDRRSGIDRRIFGSNIAGLDLAKGMERFSNDRETYLGVMKSFAVNTKPLLERIREPGSPEEGGISLKDYAVIVHGIKGSSRGIGAMALGAKAEALEHAAKKGDGDFVAAKHGEFIAATDQLIEGIEASLAGFEQENPKPKKEKPESESLEKLLAACTNYNMDEADSVIADIEKWEYEADEGLAAWLKENVDLMNFTEVVERLSVLLNKNV